jgi:hypothetical protein
MERKNVLHRIANVKIVFYLCNHKTSPMTLYQFVKRKIKRVFLKYYLWIHRRPLDQKIDPTMDRYQQTCFHISRKLLKQSDTELIFAPVSEKKIIINDRLGIYLTLQHQQAFVTNHVYHYSIIMDARVWQRVNFLFNNEIELRRKSYETVIHSQINCSLTDILKKI